MNQMVFVKASRAEVIGSMAALVPGDLVLDVGSACGHMARWFYEPWYGMPVDRVKFLGVFRIWSFVLVIFQ